MDINKILNELRSEREEIKRAIIALERFAGKRRGRPPKCQGLQIGFQVR